MPVNESTGAYPSLDALQAPRRRRFIWRTLLGCLIVLLASAGATAVFVLEQVHTVVQDLSINKPLTVDSRVLAQSSFGQPETLLLVGNDTRSVFKYYRGYVPNLANEMLLVRIDPSKPWISMMSLPRELWVPITGPRGQAYAANRLNSAYTYGTSTLLQTIKQITGLSVNHVIATTFTQFEKAINTLGCVYDTVDERYYHNNALGGAQYQNIDLQPGYQCLNGSESEQFVSYRHTDTSQVRDARDQSFLLAVKKQYGPQLAGNVGKFERVFGETVQTDAGLRTQTEILHLANLLISAEGLHVRQVHFQASPCIGTCPAGDLTASSQQVQQSVNDFLHGGGAAPTTHVAAAAHKVGRRSGLAGLPLTATLAANVAAEKIAAAKLKFTAEFPKVQDLAGSADPVGAQCTQVMQPCIRSYLIHAPSGNAYPIYVEVFSNGELGQYYDVQGTTWTNAPLFKDPSQTLRIGPRTYDLYYAGSHLQTVAWRQYGAIYWVHNTLTDGVSNSELLAIAEQTAPVAAVRRTPAHLTIKAFSVPARTAPKASAPILRSIGRIGGLVALALVPLGLAAVFLGRRRSKSLRARAQAIAVRRAELEAQVARLAAGQRPVPSPPLAVGAMLPPGARRGAGPPPAVGARSMSRGAGTGVIVALVAVALGAGAYFALQSDAQGHLSRRHNGVPAIPSAPVAVLNAGSAPGAAHRLAVTLSHQRVRVVATGNLRGTSPTRYEVLYRPGSGRQAQLLARVLKADHPRVGPIAAAAVRAAGSIPRLVVVIP